MNQFYHHELVEEDGRKHLVGVAVEGCPMPDSYLNGRPVYFGDLYIDGVDSYFESASYADTDEDLSDDELDQLQEKEGDYIVQQNCEKFGYFPK